MRDSLGTNKIRVPFHIKYWHLIAAGIGWLIFLAAFFFLKAVIPPRFFIHCALDDVIPFVKWSVFAYCLWYFYMGGTLVYFGIVSKPDFIKLQAYIFAGFGLCLAFYIVYPNAINFRPVLTPEKGDIIGGFIAHLFSVDNSAMVTPSMHVFAAAATHISIAKSAKTGQKKALVACSLIITVLICASTVLMKQHSIIDVFWGLVLAAALYIPVYKRNLISDLKSRRASGSQKSEKKSSPL